MNEDTLYESLEYGGYILEYEDGYLSENVKYAGAEFNKLYTRRVRLPEGSGNIVYLMSNSFDNTIKMITNNNFIVPPVYRKLYYPQISVGKFMGRRYRVNVRKLYQERNKLISSKTKLSSYSTTMITNISGSIFFSLGDIYQSIEPIMKKLTINRLYQEFWKDFIDIIKGLSPEPDMKNNKPADNNRIIIIDADAFSFKRGGSLDENKTNPLFLLYMAYLKTHDLSKFGVDVDMLICHKNIFMKFNPSKLSDNRVWQTFRRCLFRIINANLDDYTASLSDDEKTQIDDSGKGKLIDNIIDDRIDPYTKGVSPSTKSTLVDAIKNGIKDKASNISALDHEIKVATKSDSQKPVASRDEDVFMKTLQPTSVIHTNPAVNPLNSKQEKLFRSMGDYAPLTTKTNLMIDDDDTEDDYENLDDFEDEIADDVDEMLTADEEIVIEVINEIQDKIAPLNNPNTAPINSPRDKKLREEQKKIVVKNESIEEILSRDANNVPIKREDHSSVLHTSNKNMYDIGFSNFDKTYIDELMTKDLVACFDILKDKNSPFYITKIDIKDTSDSLNYKETWTISMVDENKKRHTIKVDIPKIDDGCFMLIKGTKWILLKQNFYNPLVKDTPDTVMMTSNFNKVTVHRKSTKSITTVERIFSLSKKLEKIGDNTIFIGGDSSRSNMKYISSLEYDEISRNIFKYSSNGCEIYFSRDYIEENLLSQVPSDIKGNEFFVGNEGGRPILINEDSGLDRQGRTISEIIEDNLDDTNRALFQSVKAPTQLMYVEAKMAGQFLPVIAILLVWVGISKTLDRMGIDWKFDPSIRRAPQGTKYKYIRFADGFLQYEASTFAELILNGIVKLHPEKKQFVEFNTEEGYSDFIYSQWGSYSGILELRNFYEFMIDPITKDTCRNLMLPDDSVGLLIHAVKLLCDNVYVSKASDKSYRTRSTEIIAGVLYSCIAAQYKAYVRSGRRIPMTLNQNCVIQNLIAGSAKNNVEAYSTLNPVIEISKKYTISAKGYRGSNSDHAYRDEQKRSYDPTAVGKLAISTSADANVGITKFLVVDPTISNARGFRDQVEDPDILKDTNIFSPVEMLTPGTARNDDPIRTAIAGKQSQHVVPVEDAAPALVSNGYDEAVQFTLSDDFVINAEEDGKVIDVDEETGFIMVQYKSGKTKAIYTKPSIVKNSGGGFYMSNQLKPVYNKVGQTFKQYEPLAYHDKYFKYSKMNGLRYAIGPVVKMAMMSTYNTYEDAGICTEALAERMATHIVYKQDGRFKFNNNILSMVKVGDHVNIGDPLIKYDVSTDDNELAKYLSKLSAENAELLTEEIKNELKAQHAGEVVDIKVYTLLEPEALSPSLGKVVQEYFDIGINKKKYLERFDDNPGIMKSGYLLTDSTEPIKDRYNQIKGDKGIDVKIEIYIKHKDVMGVGDKIALYGPNKQIVSEVIPRGWEPYSEFRPDEEISVLTSPGTIQRRMTASIIAVSAAMKVMVELKRKIKSEIKFK